MKEKIIKLINNHNTICACFALLAIAMLVFNYKIIHEISFYSINGFDDDISFVDGNIYHGYDIHYFSAPNIVYNGNDYNIVEYEVGYYLENGTQIATLKSDKEQTPLNIKTFLETVELNIMEQHKKPVIFKNKNIDKIYFELHAISEKGTKIEKKVELNVLKLTK